MLNLLFPQGEKGHELEAILVRLKGRNYASYLTVRFSPPEQRVALTWLYGFLLDVEQISLKVNEPLLGEIRLQWWRDQLLKLLRSEKVGHPVADGLAPYFVNKGEALFKELIAIVDSFTFEIQKEPIKTKEELFRILDQRYGSFLRAGLILTDGEIEESEALACQAGTAIGLGVLYSELNGFLYRDIMPLPQDVLGQYELFHKDFMPRVETEDTAEGALSNSSQKRKALEALVEGGSVNSWDIKEQMKAIPRRHKALFSPWLLVPALITRSKEERARGQEGYTALNPLKIFFTLYLQR